jgi:hypothetical protein
VEIADCRVGACLFGQETTRNACSDSMLADNGPDL